MEQNIFSDPALANNVIDVEARDNSVRIQRPTQTPAATAVALTLEQLTARERAAAEHLIDFPVK